MFLRPLFNKKRRSVGLRLRTFLIAIVYQTVSNPGCRAHVSRGFGDIDVGNSRRCHPEPAEPELAKARRHEDLCTWPLMGRFQMLSSAFAAVIPSRLQARQESLLPAKN